MSANTSASQPDSTAKTDTEVQTQSTLVPKKGSLVGDVWIDKVPRQRFTLDGVEGDFTCKYLGAEEWTTQESETVSETVTIHSWICKHSSDPSAVHIDRYKNITGTHLPKLLPPGLEFQFSQSHDTRNIKFGGLRVSGATYAVTDKVKPPGIFLDALEKTSSHGPFFKLDYAHWTYGEREDIITRHPPSVTSRVTKCQDRLMVLGTLKEVEDWEFNDFFVSQQQKGISSKPVRDDMTSPGTCTVS